jgi:Spy/CpxP family protein refolding chaperone
MAVNPPGPAAPGTPGVLGTPDNGGVTDADLADADQQQHDTPPTPQQLRELRAEAAKWRRMYQTARTAEEELGRLKAAGQSELERANARASEMEQHRTRAEQEAMRLRVGLTHGLVRQRPDGSWDTTLAQRLQGSTVEELEADAKELARSVPAATPGNGQPGQQRQRMPNAAQNASGAAPASGDPNAWLRDKLSAGRS